MKIKQKKPREDAIGGKGYSGKIRKFASRHELASYIAEVTLELRNMTKGADMTFLSYLLEMSFHEALDISQEPRADL